MKGISVIICCHNSIDRLKPTLEHIACQAIASGINWELIIIDNASVDGSGEFAKVELERLNFSYSYKILTENKPGLIHARKRAIKESNYEYLLFCDDDNWLAADYVRTAFMIMESNLSIGALGGCGEPVYESAPPVWFQKMGIQYATGKQGDTSGEVPRQLSYVYGAGAIYRKSVFEKLNFLEVDFYLTGRIGKRLLASEDVEIGYWVTLLGYKIWFSDQLKFMHFTETRRLSWKYVLANAYGHGYSRAFLRPYQEILFGHTYRLNADLFKLFRDCVSLVKNLPYNIARRQCMINIGQRCGEINAYLQNRKQITLASIRISNIVALISSVID